MQQAFADFVAELGPERVDGGRAAGGVRGYGWATARRAVPRHRQELRTDRRRTSRPDQRQARGGDCRGPQRDGRRVCGRSCAARPALCGAGAALLALRRDPHAGVRRAGAEGPRVRPARRPSTSSGPISACRRSACRCSTPAAFRSACSSSARGTRMRNCSRFADFFSRRSGSKRIEVRAWRRSDPKFSMRGFSAIGGGKEGPYAIRCAHGALVGRKTSGIVHALILRGGRYAFSSCGEFEFRRRDFEPAALRLLHHDDGHDELTRLGPARRRLSSPTARQGRRRRPRLAASSAAQPAAAVKTVEIPRCKKPIRFGGARGALHAPVRWRQPELARPRCRSCV